ncbi:hypothetical protein GGQ92_000450 [Gracilibacillus halotolerans]|uniref:Transcobalamin-like C-terminal domain-containing protein n=1 Tax=Gracilibacillus halotolerans TaxID=74386 RepID=A0A841RJ60_9BACI|nr:DUF4430 domain-containing protein [Gracilibacillus halotolerans]MBB6511683.1 hypothetical protein [Gracilibacillus halotolerans]
MKFRTIAFLLLILTSVFVVGCSSDTTTEDDIEVTITLYDEVNDTTIASDDLVVQEGQVLQDILEANYDVEVQQGGFITSIEGHSQNESDSIFWVFEVNEEVVNEGASSYEVQDEDYIEFKLMQFE